MRISNFVWLPLGAALLWQSTSLAPPPDKTTAPDKATPIFVGTTPTIRESENNLGKFAASNSSILILGETGSGKDVLARRLHDLSPRKNKKFVAVNLASINPELIDAALFGVAKGAFTGATEAKPGLLEFANGGTLFLDELGEMPAATQVKLLAALETRRVKPVGSNDSVPVNFRLISATNVDIEEAVEKGTFREDLMYRVNTVVFTTVPLRERQADIPALADYFLDLDAKERKTVKKTLSSEVLQAFLRYPWRGNFREFSSIIKSSALLSDGPVIQLRNIPDRISNFKPKPKELALHEPVPLSPAAKPPARPITEHRQNLVAACQGAFGDLGSLSGAAKALGISPETLKRILDTPK